MRYQVPQFIDIEDKIIGLLTLKQFFYLISVPALCYVLHFFVKLPYVILVGIIFFPLAIMFAFVKINGRPFSYTVASFFHYALKPQLYIWKKVPTKTSGAVSSEERISEEDKQKAKKQVESSESGAVKDFKKLAEILDKSEEY